MLLAAVCGYLLLQFALCWLVSRWIKTEADYLVAGRSLGLGFAVLSLFATWFGAEIVMGSASAIAQHGLSGGRADPFGYTLCLLFMGLLIAEPLRRSGYLTVGDFFKAHYGRTVEILSSLIFILTSLIWTAAQIQAFAIILSSISPLDMSQTLPLAVVVVIAYTWLGGLLGDVITDVLQGGLMVLGLAILFALLLHQSGGFSVALTQIPAGHWSLFRPNESVLGQFNVWLIPILGSLVAPEALTRTLATRTPAMAKHACYGASALYLVVGTIVVGIALTGGPLLAQAGMSYSGDNFLPALVQHVLPPWASALLLGALVSAILSTIDSTLLSIAGLGSHNILIPAINIEWTEARKILLARTIVIISGIIAYAIAIGPRGIYALVELASSFGSAGFLVCMLGGLYTRGIQPMAALGVLITGVLGTIIMELGLNLDGAFIWDVVLCAALYAAALKVYPRTQPVDEPTFNEAPSGSATPAF